ncbi:sugar nucleotide processing enzyme [Pseudofrankia sp. BMG5.36]|nr:sugar nucleotide processing enzyme [Pseudofrankia sp. BMG5.36]
MIIGVLCSTEEDALGAVRRSLDLHLCGVCGTVVNVAFDPDLLEYDGHYDNSLHYSGTFRAFSAALARRLVDTHGLAARSIVEIGSGKGDFLRELCRLAGSSGTGYDPTYVGPDRAEDADVAFIVDYYGPRYSDLPGDFVVCRHVLEHIENPLAFLRNIRDALGERDASMYLEVPNGGFMLSEAGAWDYIYPHVTYFSPAGLAAVITAAGFDVTGTGTAFGDQFLWVEARTARASRDIAPGTLAPGDVMGTVGDYVASGRRFGSRYRDVVGRWTKEFAGEATPGRGPTAGMDTKARHTGADAQAQPDLTSGRVLVWGAGAKGVNFLNVVGAGAAVAGVVDLNPNKQGTFIPGTGHRVLAPEEIAGMDIDRVLLPNALYLDEVRAFLDKLDVRAEVIPLLTEPRGTGTRGTVGGSTDEYRSTPAGGSAHVRRQGG